MTVLESSYIVFLLQPFHANIGKRLIKSPKIYFYDVGLASWLCGIEKEKQVATHPLRGSLFENMAIMEALKYRYNQGNRNNLYFYRDSNGNEIDLIYGKGQDMLPIEIKSGQTITSTYFSSLKKFYALFPDHLPWLGFLIYGGEAEQSRQDSKVMRIFSFPQHLAEIEKQ